MSSLTLFSLFSFFPKVENAGLKVNLQSYITTTPSLPALHAYQT